MIAHPITYSERSWWGTSNLVCLVLSHAFDYLQGRSCLGWFINRSSTKKLNFATSIWCVTHILTHIYACTDMAYCCTWYNLFLRLPYCSTTSHCRVNCVTNASHSLLGRQLPGGTVFPAWRSAMATVMCASGSQSTEWPCYKTSHWPEKR